MLFEHHLIHESKSAGTSEQAKVKISQKLIDWANIIFVMEPKHKEIIKQKFPSAFKNKLILVLGIADEYTYGDNELTRILNNALAKYL